MVYLEFDTTEPFTCNIAGKFSAESDEWIHRSRNLTDFELVLLTEGDLYIAENKLESVVRTGEFRLMHPTPYQHGTRPSSCSFYWLHFQYKNGTEAPKKYDTAQYPNGILPLIPAGKKAIRLPVSGHVPKPDRLIILMKQLADCQIKYHNRQLNNFYTSVILCELSAQLDEEYGIRQSDQTSQLFSDINGYIDRHIKDNLKVEQVAEYFGYNSKYITTLFHKYSGMSIKQYILDRKIEIAKSLLTETNRQVADIGYEIGFSDNHNFSNTFRRIVGMTPSDYRNTYNERIVNHQ